MRRLLVLTFVLAALVAVATVASATMIDDFSADPASSEWVMSIVLGSGNGPTFDAANDNDNLHISDSDYDALAQSTFLRDDYTLGVGETLLTDVVSVSAGVSGAGLAVCATDSPTTRLNLMTIAMSYNAGISKMRPDTTLFDDEGGEYHGASGAYTAGGPDQLYISRTDANTYELGSITGGTATAIQTWVNGVVADFDVTGAVGYWSDIRTTSGVAELDSLQMIPEPGAVLMIVTGLVLCGVWRRK